MCVKHVLLLLSTRCRGKICAISSGRLCTADTSPTTGTGDCVGRIWRSTCSPTRYTKHSPLWHCRGANNFTTIHSEAASGEKNITESPVMFRFNAFLENPGHFPFLSFCMWSPLWFRLQVFGRDQIHVLRSLSFSRSFWSRLKPLGRGRGCQKYSGT